MLSSRISAMNKKTLIVLALVGFFIGLIPHALSANSSESKEYQPINFTPQGAPNLGGHQGGGSCG